VSFWRGTFYGGEEVEAGAGLGGVRLECESDEFCRENEVASGE